MPLLLTHRTPDPFRDTCADAVAWLAARRFDPKEMTVSSSIRDQDGTSSE
jgi:hypothetical protein